ncbi:MAG: hypothetical protein ACM3ML_29895 [Micromonosporaceae bacterium]
MIQMASPWITIRPNSLLCGFCSQATQVLADTAADAYSASHPANDSPFAAITDYDRTPVRRAPKNRLLALIPRRPTVPSLSREELICELERLFAAVEYLIVR